MSELARALIALTALALLVALCGCPSEPTDAPSATPTATRGIPTLPDFPTSSPTPFPTPVPYCSLVPQPRCCRLPWLDCPDQR